MNQAVERRLRNQAFIRSTPRKRCQRGEEETAAVAFYSSKRFQHNVNKLVCIVSTQRIKIGLLYILDCILRAYIQARVVLDGFGSPLGTWAEPQFRNICRKLSRELPVCGKQSFVKCNFKYALQYYHYFFKILTCISF